MLGTFRKWVGSILMCILPVLILASITYFYSFTVSSLLLLHLLTLLFDWSVSKMNLLLYDKQSSFLNFEHVWHFLESELNSGRQFAFNPASDQNAHLGSFFKRIFQLPVFQHFYYFLIIYCFYLNEKNLSLSITMRLWSRWWFKIPNNFLLLE